MSGSNEFAGILNETLTDTRSSAQKPKHIVILAGEASGDFLGAELMAALGRANPGGILFSGVGGPRMEAEGMRSLFDYNELSLMGFAELLPHLPKLQRYIHQTVEHIADAKPDAVITIDSPGFNLRVARKVRAARRFAGSKPALIHMVAPSVWAYKPKRAEKFAAVFDRLLALLPFEPAHFEASGLPCDWMGSPVAWDWRIRGDSASFKQTYHLPSENPVLGVFLGSRRGEIERHWPLFRKAVQRLQQEIPNLITVLPITPARREQVEFLLAQEGWPTAVTLVDPTNAKKNCFAALDAALAKSGTVSLELALARVAQIVAYRVHPFTAWLVRRWIRIPYVSLANILNQRAVIPELLQDDCTPAALHRALLPLLTDKHARDAQLEALAPGLKQLLPADGSNPSDVAARLIIQTITAHAS